MPASSAHWQNPLTNSFPLDVTAVSGDFLLRPDARVVQRLEPGYVSSDPVNGKVIRRQRQDAIISRAQRFKAGPQAASETKRLIGMAKSRWAA